MRIWRFAAPPTSQHARAFVPGYLLAGLDEAASLTIEWHPGFDQIGDFTLTGVEEIVVKSQIAREPSETFRGFGLRPVTMIQDPELEKPQRVTKRTTPRVWLPYDGPLLVNLRVEAVVDADPRRWPIVQDKTGEHYKVEGTEELYDGFLEVFWSSLSSCRIPRNRKKGFRS